VIEIDLRLQRGNFRLEVRCTLATPWTVVFGPSGAGKSTLLRLIAGLDRVAQPDSARIAIHGQYVQDTQTRLWKRPGSLPGQRATGMVTQQSALFPHLRVLQNVTYGLIHLGESARRQQALAMLELVGAAHLADRFPRQLSGGEAQRVALARALAPLPRLLLLDEPLSALDAGARDQLLLRLQPWLSERSIQAILVTHDAADALATDAEVALLHEGKLTALGPAGTILAEERARLLSRLAPKTKPRTGAKFKTK